MPYVETTPGGGKVRRKSEKYYAVFVDFAGVLRRIPLYPDRQSSEGMARVVNRLNSLRASNETLPPDLARDVADMPGGILDRLARWDIIRPEKAAMAKPLAMHVEDWRASILAKGGTAQHAETSASRVRRIVAGLGLKTVADVSPGRVQTFLAALRQSRTDAKGIIHRGISAASFNHYLVAARSFFRWMIRDGRASSNPLEHLQGVNAGSDKRHERRALCVDELRALLDTTAAGPDRYGMSGAVRALLYRLAVETGLRSTELASLTRGSFHLGENPTVTIAAAYAKNRREDVLPLRPGTATALADHLRGKMPVASAFNMPNRFRIIDGMKADLTAARTAWIAAAGSQAEREEREASTFLAYRDDAGRCADFHSLRHTFISNLAAGGVHPKTAQRLARHSTIGLTMDRYTHLRREDLAGAIGTLPDLSSARQIAVATGTDYNKHNIATLRAASLSPNHAIQRNSAHLGAQTGESLADSIPSGNIERISGFTEVKTAPGLLAELADALDSKSSARKGVSVRLR